MNNSNQPGQTPQPHQAGAAAAAAAAAARAATAPTRPQMRMSMPMHPPMTLGMSMPPQMPYQMPTEWQMPNQYASFGTQQQQSLPWSPVNQQAPPLPSNFLQYGKPNTSFHEVEDECAICTRNTKNLNLFLPCGHYPYCGKCMINMSTQTPGALVCPQCKKQVEDTAIVHKIEFDKQEEEI